MKKFYFLLLFLISIVGYSQENATSNQNTNYQKAYEKQIANSSNYTQLQGTTVQQTYKAIDPMEEKRERTKIRKDFQAQRSLWRHQERIERAKNTHYYTSQNNFPYSYSNYINPFLTFGLTSYLLFH